MTEIWSSDNDGYWGGWGSAQYCPQGSFVYGYRQKTESKQGGGDDTALNAIELHCVGPNNNGLVRITSSTQKWGNWDSPSYCSGHGNPVTGFQMQIEKEQGKGDDTAANGIKLFCKNGGHILAGRHTNWGTWRSVVKCPHGTAVVGIKTRIEKSVGKGDDTALNGVRLICFDYLN